MFSVVLLMAWSGCAGAADGGLFLVATESMTALMHRAFQEKNATWFANGAPKQRRKWSK